MPKITRIVSDLHIGHRASLLDHVEEARPLSEGVDHLVFNGDTLELKYGDLETAKVNAAELKRGFDQETADWGVATTLITGNHDPAISDIHAIELAQGKILITHGDALFKVIAPWRANQRSLRICTEEIDENQRGNGMPDLHELLCRVKQASIRAHAMEGNYNPTVWGKGRIFLHQAWPPTTPFRILKAWREVPDRAVSLANRFELKPKFIIVGHSHLPGIWKRDSQIVINLGSYFPWPGALCVDISEDTLTVRRVGKRRRRVFLKSPIAEFEIDTVS